MKLAYACALLVVPLVFSLCHFSKCLSKMEKIKALLMR